MTARALVVGLTIHGLAVARALARAGVTVDAFASPGGFSPCARTRYATVHRRDGLNRPALLEHLLRFGEEHGGSGPIVLFPTSDRMVETIVAGWDRLAPHYRVSWAHCRELVLELQSKDRLADYAARAGVRYPESVVIRSAADARGADLPWPGIVKPARPLSRFKAFWIPDRTALLEVVAHFEAELPFVAQRCIPGGDGTLYACTLFLDHGRELGSLVSRKLAADPPGTGQGTVFETCDEPGILALSRRFLAGLDLSGPVALEFKRDPEGRFWLIEPNVARTEYCVDLAIESGFNVPLMEYHAALGGIPPAPVFKGHHSWYDTDKAPLCWLRQGFGRAGTRAVFPFAGHGDWAPLSVAVVRDVVRGLREGAARIRGSVRATRESLGDGDAASESP